MEDVIPSAPLLVQAYDSGMPHQHYLNRFAGWVVDKKTSGTEQSASRIDFTRINWQRVKRWNKTLQIQPALREIITRQTTPLKFLIITEAWCGDAAQNIPVIAKMVALNPLWGLRLVLRDENPELMDLYLTNGGRSIPKVIAFDETGTELFNWGPRPRPAQEMVMHYKHMPEPRPDYTLFSEQLHKWYTMDKGQTLQRELTDLIMTSLTG